MTSRDSERTKNSPLGFWKHGFANDALPISTLIEIRMKSEKPAQTLHIRRQWDEYAYTMQFLAYLLVLP